MKLRKVTLLVAFLLAPGFILAVLFHAIPETAFGQSVQSEQPPSPLMFFKMGLSGIAGDEDHLFVMAGGKIMVYQISGMSLLKSVDLPDPPADALPPKPNFSSFDPRSNPPPFPPPFAHPHGRPQGLWASDHFLFVLAGPMIYEYSTPDLALVSTTQLPKPELPK